MMQCAHCMATKAFDQLCAILGQGRAYQPERPDDLRQFLGQVFEERYHSRDHKHFQPRNALSRKAEDAAWAGWIPADNPTSGAYQGTSIAWFPGDGGSVFTLCIGTGGFGPDAHLLARPGHRRRLRALARLHRGLWVKPDFLDLDASVPATVADAWPEIAAAAKTYGRYIYAAHPVRTEADRAAIEDLLDLFFHDHGVSLKGDVTKRWEARRRAMLASLFPRVSEAEVAALLEERRFVILEGPPGTGKTRLGQHVAQRFPEPTQVQFHPARTYEDFVIGLMPVTSGQELAFSVRAGDLVRANDKARARAKHVLFIDEINRGDLARVLGEAIYLFEVGEPDRAIDLPHEHQGQRTFRLAPGLMVLGTRNTADRSIARMDLAIRRRFAFLDVWPDLEVVEAQGDELATKCFAEVLNVFTEHADEAGLHLVPGHAYFLDPRADMGAEGRPARIARRIRFELLPLLRTYVDERLLGPATAEIAGLADAIEHWIDTAAMSANPAGEPAP